SLLRLQAAVVHPLEVTRGDEPYPAPANWVARLELCLVLASEVYPESPRKGQVIARDLFSEPHEDVQVFHAGTAQNSAGDVVVSGGRVLGITALGDTLEEARTLAYERASRIDFEGKIFRGDIGEYRWVPGPIHTD
ncbi:MAG: phosphoribosylamine--glycine ligase, partial [Planctomycetia bacterium]|nr:phosphoribosylamine--glycine ligase [Planctomycetia bacterium]